MKLLAAGLSGIAVGAVVFFAAATAMVPGNWLPPFREPSTDNAYVQGDVTPIAPKVSGYIAEVAIRDHQFVKAGDVLVRIEDSDYRARVNEAQAGVATRRAMLVNLRNRIDQQGAVIDQATAALRGVQAEAHRTELDLGRFRELAAREFISRARLDQAESEHLRNLANIAQAEANVAAARAQLHVLNSQRPQILAEIDGAVAVLTLAEIEHAHTVVRAPSDGQVGERQARVGQYVRPGPLLVAIVPHEFWVVANFKETQVAAMRNGDLVKIHVDAIGDSVFTGRIDSLSPATGAQFALLAPDNATGNFTRIVQRIPVKITFDPGQQGYDRLRPGMSAAVALNRVTTRPHSSMASTRVPEMKAGTTRD
jgi:membrane fusion protein, multidrug efflux system